MSLLYLIGGSKTSMANREPNMGANVSQLFVVVYYTYTNGQSALALIFEKKNECYHKKMQTASISLLFACSLHSSFLWLLWIPIG